MKCNNPLLDLDFLKELTEKRSRVIYARVVALNMNEEAIEEIAGRVSEGSITTDGTSSVRRSCSMTLVATEMNINNYYWGLNSKIEIYIGLENTINKNYDSVVWFKQGIFILSQFNTSQSVNSYAISLQGKDKMSMLNGELGGVVKSLTADFGVLKDYSQKDENGNTIVVKTDIPIKDIIREAVHKYGNEQYKNIIINDIDEYGLELLEYRGDEESPLYFIINFESGEVENMTMDGSKVYYLDSDNSQIEIEDIPVYDPRIEKDFGWRENVTKVYSEMNGPKYTVAKIVYGETCGYRLTDLTYPGPLTAQVGDAITTAVLDKIVNMLGNFEYFYDLDGKFVFQKKKTYIDTSWNNIVNDGVIDHYQKIDLTKDTYKPNQYYILEDGSCVVAASYTFNPNIDYYEFIDGEFATSKIETSPISYYFGDGTLTTAFQNSPNLANLKNDFSIWGERESAVSNTKTPIHMRYAIDKKPYYYKAFPKDSNAAENEKLQTVYTTLNEEEYSRMTQQKYETENGYYVKTPNPEGLSEDWWEIIDWAEYYKICTGSYPVGRIGDYCTNGGLDMSLVLPKITFVYGIPSTPGHVNKWGYFDTMPIYVFDVEADGTIGYTGHGTSCNHEYSYFLGRSLRNQGTSYIYMPRLPKQIVSDNGGVSILKETVKYNLDWRELIYQMALDYNAHCNEDNYMIDLMKYNKDFYENTGMTGYEQYYTDLEGFWRTLYNPDEAPVLDQPDDSMPEYYKWDAENEKYIPIKFEDLVTINTLPNESSIFHIKKGDTYYKLSRINDGPFYKKQTPLDLTVLQEDKKYYQYSGGNYVPYIKTTFDTGHKYYAYNGYKRVNILEKGKTYYTRTGTNGEYNYSEAISFSSETQYFHKDIGVEDLYIKVQSFAKGNTYYYYDGNNYALVFEYGLDDVYYEFMGYDLVLDLSDYRIDLGDILCVKTEDNIFTRIESNTLEIGHLVEFYKRVPDNELVNGKYYKWNNSKSCFEYVELIVNFELGKKYYIKDSTGEMIYYNIYSWKNTSDIIYSRNFYNINTGWITDINTDPSNLIFWFDFLDTGGEISKYSVNAVGDRSKAINDTDVKAIYYRDTPNVIFVNSKDWDKERDVKSGYTYVKLPLEMENLFHISSQGKTAQDELETFLYNYTYCTETINMTTVPIYHLQPNTRISVRDDNSQINGEYLVTRLTMPLAYNGTMSISAIKAVDRLY